MGFEQASASFGWAMRKVQATADTTEKAVELQLAQMKLDGILSRLVTKPGTDTVVWNVLRDGTAFARVPEPGACSFCLMLASRGAVYTRETVGRVNRFHDHCRCLGIECRRDGSNLPRINRDLEREWERLSVKLDRVPNVVDFEQYLRDLKLSKKWPKLQRVKVPGYRGDWMSKAFPGEALPTVLNRLVGHVLYGWRDRPRKGEKDFPHKRTFGWGTRGTRCVRKHRNFLDRGRIRRSLIQMSRLSRNRSVLNLQVAMENEKCIGGSVASS